MQVIKLDNFFIERLSKFSNHLANMNPLDFGNRYQGSLNTSLVYDGIMDYNHKTNQVCDENGCKVVSQSKPIIGQRHYVSLAGTAYEHYYDSLMLSVLSEMVYCFEDDFEFALLRSYNKIQVTFKDDLLKMIDKNYYYANPISGVDVLISDYMDYQLFTSFFGVRFNYFQYNNIYLQSNFDYCVRLNHKIEPYLIEKPNWVENVLHKESTNIDVSNNIYSFIDYVNTTNPRNYQPKLTTNFINQNKTNYFN